MRKALLLLFVLASSPFEKGAAYQHFAVAVYCTARDVQNLSDSTYFERTFDLLTRQLYLDKVYLEVHRRTTIDEAALRTVKRRFEARGIRTAGGLTPTGGTPKAGHFGVLCYSNPQDLRMLFDAVRLAARNFDELILDDFFFTSCKCRSCLREKGNLSWTEFRLRKLTEVSRKLVSVAKGVNPQIRVVIKYPNWYEYYQFTGYNLATQPGIFDGIYTGTETRDPVYTHQNLQPYQSYLIFRFLSNVAPGKNGGGWVDPLARGTLDRYAQQLRLTLLAGAKEITLFHWGGLFRRLPDGDYVSDLLAVAGATFEETDALLGGLERPEGLNVYKPLNSSGEDFLPTYLGMLGIPLELSDRVPEGARKVLFTANAADDAGALEKMRDLLARGGEVILTTGLLKRLEGRGVEELISARLEAQVEIDRTSDLQFRDVYRTAGPILLPKVVAPTNDCWKEVVGLTPAGTSVPLLTRTSYLSGTVWLLTIPDDFASLYWLPRETLWEIKRLLLPEQPVLLDAPPGVALFTYRSRGLVVHSFLDHSCRVRLHFRESVRPVDLMTGRPLARGEASRELDFTLPAGGYRAVRF